MKKQRSDVSLAASHAEVYSESSQTSKIELFSVTIFSLDTGRKLNVHKMFRRPPGRLSERLMYVQLTSCAKLFDRILNTPLP